MLAPCAAGYCRNTERTEHLVKARTNALETVRSSIAGDLGRLEAHRPPTRRVNDNRLPGKDSVNVASARRVPRVSFTNLTWRLLAR